MMTFSRTLDEISPEIAKATNLCITIDVSCNVPTLATRLGRLVNYAVRANAHR
jgi:hypothetical protein